LTSLPHAPITIGAHGFLLVPWYTFLTTNPAIFQATSGDFNLMCHGHGAYTFETKVLVNDVNAVYSATIVGEVISHNDGGDTAWYGNWNWIKSVSPDGLGTELSVRDVATGWTSGLPGFRRAQVRVTNYDGGPHDLNIAYFKAVFVPTVYDLVQVFP